MTAATTLYLAGPRTGWVDYNYPTFDAVAAVLREAGYTVLSPSEIDGAADESLPRVWCLRKAIGLLVEADAAALLPYWDESRGARLERKLALDLSMTVQPVEVWLQRAEEQHAGGLDAKWRERLRSAYESMRRVP